MIDNVDGRPVTSNSALLGNILSGFVVLVATAGLVGTWVNQRITPVEEKIATFEHTIEARLDAVDKRIEKAEVTMAPLLTLYAQHTADLDKMTNMQKQVDAKLEKEVYATSDAAFKKEIADTVVSNHETFAEVIHQIHALEEKIVSRDDNKQVWSTFDKRLESQENRLNALITQILSQFQDTKNITIPPLNIPPLTIRPPEK